MDRWFRIEIVLWSCQNPDCAAVDPLSLGLNGGSMYIIYIYTCMHMYISAFLR